MLCNNRDMLRVPQELTRLDVRRLIVGFTLPALESLCGLKVFTLQCSNRHLYHNDPLIIIVKIVCVFVCVP